MAWGREVIDLALRQGLDVGLRGLDVRLAQCLLRPRSRRLGPHQGPATGVRRRSARPARRPAGEVRLVRPWEVGDYVDFYASREHATNMGRLMRPGERPLPPAWLHLPIGYHGRAGTIVVSGSTFPARRRLAGPRPSFGPDRAAGRRGRARFRCRLPGLPGVSPIPAARCRPPRLRRRPGQRLERPRHSGLRVPAHWALSAASPSPPPCHPGSYRWPPSTHGGFDGPGQDPPPAALSCGWPNRAEWMFTWSWRQRCVLSAMTSRHLYWSMAQQLAQLTVNGAGFAAGRPLRRPAPSPGPRRAPRAR